MLSEVSQQKKLPLRERLRRSRRLPVWNELQLALAVKDTVCAATLSNPWWLRLFCWITTLFTPVRRYRSTWQKRGTCYYLSSTGHQEMTRVARERDDTPTSCWIFGEDGHFKDEYPFVCCRCKKLDYQISECPLLPESHETMSKAYKKMVTIPHGTIHACTNSCTVMLQWRKEDGQRTTVLSSSDNTSNKHVGVRSSVRSTSMKTRVHIKTL